jgi:hypothetical protein
MQKHQIGRTIVVDAAIVKVKPTGALGEDGGATPSDEVRGEKNRIGEALAVRRENVGDVPLADEFSEPSAQKVGVEKELERRSSLRKEKPTPGNVEKQERKWQFVIEEEWLI